MKLIAAASYQKSSRIFLVHEFFVTDQDTTGVLGRFCCKNLLTRIRLELKIRQFWSLTRILQEYPEIGPKYYIKDKIALGS